MLEFLGITFQVDLVWKGVNIKIIPMLHLVH
jgi:hypothetical protein